MIFGPIKLVLRIISGLISLVILYAAFGLVQVWMAGSVQPATSAPVIAVFGPFTSDALVSTDFAARLDAAATLDRAHGGATIYVVGSAPHKGFTSEAQLGYRYLASRHLANTHIHVISEGNDVWTDAVALKKLMGTQSSTPFTLVSDPWQAYRTLNNLKAQGLNATFSPSVKSASGGVWKYLGESGLVAVGRIVGYQTVSQWTSTVTSVSSQLSGK